MSKRVPLSTKPQSPRQPSAEEWVSAATPPPTATPSAPEPAAATVATDNPEPTKRLTIDIPAQLHSRIKSRCALQGSKMADEIRLLLEERFPEA